MTFTIVKVEPYLVGGLVVPGLEPGVTRDSDGLMEFTVERLRARNIRDLTVVFVCHPRAGWSAVFGYRCDEPEELAVGDSMVRVGEKFAARFVLDGPSPDPYRDLWRQVEMAEKEGLINRALGEEVACIPERGEPELYISLA
ncbi:hypothetical protein MX572_05575 [Rhodococcus pyridinivorans]|uniref:hypothetical protein n=1 Tax=Rhodococcus pyridinivorans TaxID=103816 RepID=UPI0020C5E7CE|nr:hypothetical protein [Rhodococcus pyridinivorans]UTM38253.1 hypothetical protein MX572_05575 [Rhodococcus pyridinivorans]